jgi:hypothetical protein
MLGQTKNEDGIIVSTLAATGEWCAKTFGRFLARVDTLNGRANVLTNSEVLVRGVRQS